MPNARFLTRVWKDRTDVRVRPEVRLGSASFTIREVSCPAREAAERTLLEAVPRAGARVEVDRLWVRLVRMVGRLWARREVVLAVERDFWTERRMAARAAAGERAWQPFG